MNSVLKFLRCAAIYPCFATRLGGVSGGKATQGWRVSSHTAIVGAGRARISEAADCDGDVFREAFVLPVNRCTLFDDVVCAEIQPHLAAWIAFRRRATAGRRLTVPSALS